LLALRKEGDHNQRMQANSRSWKRQDNGLSHCECVLFWNCKTKNLCCFKLLSSSNLFHSNRKLTCCPKLEKDIA
jgi:hypothetical protein